jgi:hypothetical protein
VQQPPAAPQADLDHFRRARPTRAQCDPIVDAAHDDQSTFPPWALVPFFALFTPFIVPAAFSFPDVPIVIDGYAGIAIAHVLYETIHAVHHQPFEPHYDGASPIPHSGAHGAGSTASTTGTTRTTSAT